MLNEKALELMTEEELENLMKIGNLLKALSEYSPNGYVDFEIEDIILGSIRYCDYFDNVQIEFEKRKSLIKKKVRQ